VLTSQPSAAMPSQSAKPALHVATVHPPDAHPAVAFASEHTDPHAPQCAASVWVSTHVIAAPAPHTMRGVGQSTRHAPATQSCPLGHAVPHAPQCVVLVFVLVSQPLAAMPSQCRSPRRRTPRLHAPIAHAPVPLAGAHAIPQPPQCAALVLVSVSQPFAAFASQLPRPALHEATVHTPAAHAAGGARGRATPCRSRRSSRGRSACPRTSSPRPCRRSRAGPRSRHDRPPRRRAGPSGSSCRRCRSSRGRSAGRRSSRRTVSGPLRTPRRALRRGGGGASSATSATNVTRDTHVGRVGAAGVARLHPAAASGAR